MSNQFISLQQYWALWVRIIDWSILLCWFLDFVSGDVIANGEADFNMPTSTLCVSNPPWNNKFAILSVNHLITVTLTWLLQLSCGSILFLNSWKSPVKAEWEHTGKWRRWRHDRERCQSILVPHTCILAWNCERFCSHYLCWQVTVTTLAVTLPTCRPMCNIHYTGFITHRKTPSLWQNTGAVVYWNKINWQLGLSEMLCL